MTYVLNLQKMVTFSTETEAWSTYSYARCSSLSNGCGLSTISYTLCGN